jgi:hypothetical protein
MKEKREKRNKGKEKKRCLKCWRMFPISGKTNRVCPECSEKNKGLSVRVEGVIEW